MWKKKRVSKNPWNHLFIHTVVSKSLRPHGLQYARLPCPSLSPGVCPNSCPLSGWCHPTILFSFSSCQHLGLFEWVSSSHQVAKVLELQLQHQSSREYSGLMQYSVISWTWPLAICTVSSLHNCTEPLVMPPWALAVHTWVTPLSTQVPWEVIPLWSLSGPAVSWGCKEENVAPFAPVGH